MKTEEIHAWFQDTRKKENTIFGTMNYERVSNYGNVVYTMEQVLLLGNHILNSLSGLQTWVSSYNPNILWIESLFKHGCNTVDNRTSWMAYHEPKPPCLEHMKDWSFVENENVYTGPLDICYSVAIQKAHTVAVKSRTIPIRHEGKCWGGLVCMACEDDEWKWHDECLKEADMPNNVFWNKELRDTFLEEMKSIAIAPPEWTYAKPTKQQKPRDYEQKSTPFQCAVDLTYHVSNWVQRYYKNTTDLELYEWLHENLPTLEERVKADMDRAEDILAMF